MSIKLSAIILLSASWLFFSSCNQNAAPNKSTADRIYINAVIWTGDSANPKATSIAIKDSLILYVGDSIEQYKGNYTEIVDVAGKMIVPGFIDNHTHFLSGGYQLASVNLRTAKTPAEFISTLKIMFQDLNKKSGYREVTGIMRHGVASYQQKTGLTV